MNYAIVLSGGVGSRMSLTLPKQYYEVNGKSILQYVIETIEACDAIDGFVIVADENWHDYINVFAKKKMMGFALPGETRQLSIYNGLKELEKIANCEDRVIVTDGARPNVTSSIIKSCLNFENNYDGAMPVLPMKDTVYISTDGSAIDRLIDRKTVFAGQAPEAFLFGKYLDANEALLPADILSVNGSSEVAFSAGMKIALIPGDEHNYKITTIEDLARFEQEKSGE